MDRQKKILIIDDEYMITDVVKSYLEHSDFKAYIEHNGKKGLETFYDVKPDLVVLDLMLPDLSGEEICKEIRRNARTPIIMLTAKAEEEDILMGLDIGADDYMTKPFSGKQLVGRVKAVLRRTESDPVPLFNIMTFHNGDLEINLENNEVRKSGEVIRLTPSEYKILLSLVKYPNKTYSRDELIFIALGEEFDGYDRIIDTHIKKLRQKIEDDLKNPTYIQTVHGFGYKFGGGKNEA
ncbi:response regulator transcription factor [Anaerosolibacter carboniphilus]